MRQNTVLCGKGLRLVCEYITIFSYKSLFYSQERYLNKTHQTRGLHPFRCDTGYVPSTFQETSGSLHVEKSCAV